MKTFLWQCLFWASSMQILALTSILSEWLLWTHSLLLSEQQLLAIFWISLGEDSSFWAEVSVLWSAALLLSQCMLRDLCCSWGSANDSQQTQSISVLIDDQTLVGLAASTQLNFSLLVEELVPMKYCFIANAYCYVWIISFSDFSMAIVYAFIINTKSDWRWGYYLMIIYNAICILLWYFFYHLLSFHMKHSSEKRLKFIKNFDYLGIFLFISSMMIRLMRISWDRTVYSWRSEQIITTIIVRAVTLIIFGLYKVFAPLTESLILIHLFKNCGFTASVIVLSIEISSYYAFIIVWS